MANTAIRTGVGSVFSMDHSGAWVTAVSNGAWTEIKGTLSGSQEISIESELAEIRNPNTAAVDGLVFFNQKRNMSVEYQCASNTNTNAANCAKSVDHVPGMQFKMQVADDTLAGSTSAEGSIPSASYWSILRAARTRTVGEVAVWRFDLVRYGDNVSTAGGAISAPAS